MKSIGEVIMSATFCWTPPSGKVVLLTELCSPMGTLSVVRQSRLRHVPQLRLEQRFLLSRSERLAQDME
jgi:hypothetical protein